MEVISKQANHLGSILREVTLSFSSLCETRKKTAKKLAARNPGVEKHAKGGTLSRASGPQDFTRPFFSRGFLSCHVRQTKGKRHHS